MGLGEMEKEPLLSSESNTVDDRKYVYAMFKFIVAWIIWTALLWCLPIYINYVS